MTTIYLILEISALLVVVIIPMRGPKMRKTTKKPKVELSDWAINENGGLESLAKKSDPKHHTIK